jgi:tRNA-uridine 2-sulfurtransferase
VTARHEVIVALSGGVDSSVAAALLLEQGYRVTGVTMKLWGGESDSGCCSVSDVDDARRVAHQLGIDHHVFNFGDDCEAKVVAPYVSDHAAGRTPNPCVECNRHLKFDRLLRRAGALGIELIATGHHARVVTRDDGTHRIARGADRAKDQSYVLSMLGQPQLQRLRLPVGTMTKDEVRAHASRLGLRTADKPDSQDVCFITSGGRGAFLADRVPLTPGRVVDTQGAVVGSVSAVELVTVGQRKGLGLPGGDRDPRFALSVDPARATVTVGTRSDLFRPTVTLERFEWAHLPHQGEVLAQTTAHGAAHPAEVRGDVLHWREPQRRVAPGQSVVFYADDEVIGGAVAASE